MATTTITRDVLQYDRKAKDNVLVRVELTIDLERLANLFAAKVHTSIRGRSQALQGAIKAKRVKLPGQMERAIKAGQPKLTRNRLRRLTPDGLPKEYE